MDLKAKALLKDPALYVACVPVIAALFPEAGSWFEAHKEALLPLAAVLLGHFGVRMSAVKAAGKRPAPPPAKVYVTNTADKMVAPSSCITDGA